MEAAAAAADDASTDRDCRPTRVLTPEEREKLTKDQTLVTEFKRLKLEKEAEKNWDLFYKRNTTKFFKDRHWTKREFEELVGREGEEGKRKVLFEVGCGVGNFMFPLLEEDDTNTLFIYACDFSKRAVQFVKEHKSYDAGRCCVFHADITKDSLCDTVPPSTVDMATMIFVLSALHPDNMVHALTNVLQTLRPGGVLLFRDYGLYDYAMLRFAPGHKLGERFYVRQDGTRAYYFSLEVLHELAESAGYEVGQMQYVHRDTVNKKEGLCVPRIFVQARLFRPALDTASSTGHGSGQGHSHPHTSQLNSSGPSSQITALNTNETTDVTAGQTTDLQSCETTYLASQTGNQTTSQVTGLSTGLSVGKVDSSCAVSCSDCQCRKAATSVDSSETAQCCHTGSEANSFQHCVDLSGISPSDCS